MHICTIKRSNKMRPKMGKISESYKSQCWQCQIRASGPIFLTTYIISATSTKQKKPILFLKDVVVDQ